MKTIQAFAAAALAAGVLAAAAPALAAGDAPKPPAQQWSFDGVFGRYDRAQLQRGLKVYLTACQACHALRHVSYRNLVEIGLTPSEARKIAAERKVPDIGEDGQPKERPAGLNDRFVPTFANPAAARAANGGAEPPDLSLMVKAREGGADYVYALLTGYAEPPKDWVDENKQPRKLEEGQSYNRYFPGHVIAMRQPLNADGQVEYPATELDKTPPKPTISQMAKDVAAFLAWTAEPRLEDRKQMGVKVMLFLLVFTALFFAIYKKVWRDVH
jgi:ubiquinol-cytochrome c reductase cytochrome c1 subunit